eukprot:COSAG05_NODE_2735_length_2712_cov_2.337543_4_plen_98_part_00
MDNDILGDAMLRKMKAAIPEGDAGDGDDGQVRIVPVCVCTGAWQYKRPCAQQYVGKSQSCVVIMVNSPRARSSVFPTGSAIRHNSSNALLLPAGGGL